jgi:hypothetical protein
LTNVTVLPDCVGASEVWQQYGELVSIDVCPDGHAAHVWSTVFEGVLETYDPTSQVVHGVQLAPAVVEYVPDGQFWQVVSVVDVPVLT